MESRVALGVEMVDHLIDGFNLRTVAGVGNLHNLVAAHHEFLDGSGYPRHATNSDIPLEARIVTVEVIFDALTSKRAYKAARSIEEALDALDRVVAEGKLGADSEAALRANNSEAQQIIARFRERS